jgi:hypothetical protein
MPPFERRLELVEMDVLAAQHAVDVVHADLDVVRPRSSTIFKASAAVLT